MMKPMPINILAMRCTLAGCRMSRAMRLCAVMDSGSGKYEKNQKSCSVTCARPHGSKHKQSSCMQNALMFWLLYLITIATV